MGSKKHHYRKRDHRKYSIRLGKGRRNRRFLRFNHKLETQHHSVEKKYARFQEEKGKIRPESIKHKELKTVNYILF